MTAVTILSNMGTSHSWQLNELNKEIWTWCIHRGIWLTVAHIPGKTNVVADRESRQHRRELEWTLNSQLLGVFTHVTSTLLSAMLEPIQM